MESLPNGLYSITLASDKSPVGRHYVEDRSLAPKRVLCLPPDLDAPFTQSLQWTISQDEDGYLLKVLGAPTAELDGNLFAILLDLEPPMKWKIAPVAGAGENAYTIKTNDEERGWVATGTSDAETTQIEVKPTSEDSNQVFIITPLRDVYEDED